MYIYRSELRRVPTILRYIFHDASLAIKIYYSSVSLCCYYYTASVVGTEEQCIIHVFVYRREYCGSIYYVGGRESKGSIFPFLVAPIPMWGYTKGLKARYNCHCHMTEVTRLFLRGVYSKLYQGEICCSDTRFALTVRSI